MTDPTRCPRYEGCSAPLCPLDSRWQFRHYSRGEPICGLVLETAKPGGPAIVRQLLNDDQLAGAVVGAVPEMTARHPFIAHRLTRAASQRSKTAVGRTSRPTRRLPQRPALNVA